MLRLFLTRPVGNHQSWRVTVQHRHVGGKLHFFAPEVYYNLCYVMSDIICFDCVSYYEQPDDSVELRSKQPMRSSMRSSVTRSPSPPATPPEFDNGHRYQHQMRSSLRSSHQSRPRTPSPPPPPPPPPPVAPIKRLNDDSSDSRLSELQFPPPPTELGRFRETITKQTLTETIVTRLTNNQRGKLPVITEVDNSF